MINFKQMWKTILIVCSISALFADGLAHAAHEGWYLKFDGGSNSMSVDGLPLVSEMGGGGRVALAVGYDVNNWLGVELEGGALWNSSKGYWDINSIGATPLMANLVARYEKSSRFIPYVGAGLGIVWMRNTYMNNDYDTTNIAPQVKAGIRVMVSEKFSLGLDYKYLHISTEGDRISYTVTNSAISLSLGWSF